MKIAVLNYSGNVGKTTIAKHLLLPRVPGSTWLPVESINEGGDAALNYRGREFKEVLREVLSLDAVVVDIGSSNVEQAFDQLGKLGDAHEDFDYFVIPTVPADKQQTDTIKIVMDMLAMEIDPAKIKIVFNQVPSDAPLDRLFLRLASLLEKGGVQVSMDAVIRESEVFGMLEKDQTLVQAIAKDRDIKAEIRLAKSETERRALADELIASRMAKVVKQDLDAVFAALFPA